MPTGDWQPPKINIRNLIKDFLAMYSEEPEEVMIVESIANSLDAKAENITISLKRNGGDTYSITDDGEGMSESDFEEHYHGLALSTKERGSSIGFAGVGGKLYLAMLEAGHSIYTETKTTTFHGASEFTMQGDEARWRRVQPRNMVKTRTGTYVEAKLRGNHSLDQPAVERIVRENYNAILLGLYGKTKIHLSWKPSTPLQPWKPDIEDYAEEDFVVDGNKCRAIFWLAKEDFDEPLGLDLVVRGKRIKSRQWFDLAFQIKPEFSKKITGIITADLLARLLTTNKKDLKTGNERTWLAFKRKANQVVISWLSQIGALREVQAPGSDELVITSEVAEIINRMLKLPDLSTYNPFMRKTVSTTAVKSDNPDTFLEQVDGGQKVPGTGGGGNGAGGVTTEGGDSGSGYRSNDQGEELGERIKRRMKSGIVVGLADRPDRDEEAWLDPRAIYINMANPIYKKCKLQGKPQEAMHMLRCTFMTLIENVDSSKKAAFDELRKFYSAWATL
jgi:hypothetical protein